LSGYVTAGLVDPISQFGSLMALSYNNGNQYLSDHDFISHGFNADIVAYGNR